MIKNAEKAEFISLFLYAPAVAGLKIKYSLLSRSYGQSRVRQKSII